MDQMRVSNLRLWTGVRTRSLPRLTSNLGSNIPTDLSRGRCLRGFASAGDKDKDLRVNIRMLGNTLGNIVKSSDPDVFDAVEKLREKSRSWRSEGGNPDHFEDMVNDIASYDNKKLKGVARAFTHFLALANSAENHHRVRRLRERMTLTGKLLFLQYLRSYSLCPLTCFSLTFVFMPIFNFSFDYKRERIDYERR